jgi:2-iminobutanoate/2-iminopropanoate deaminase
MLIRLITSAFLLVLAASQASADTDRPFVNGARSASRAPLPFSDGVLVGDTLYIAGHIGIDPKSDRAAEDPRIEAKFVMDRVRPSSPLV